jgi:hypothetical protein
MSCHICGQEAIDRCYTCGKLFCSQHGNVNCVHCETAIAPGDSRADRVSATLLRQKDGRSAWWRPQQAEDVELPACHTCQGLARTRCKNCEEYYCHDHAGPAGLCRECGQSSLLGIVCLLASLLLMGGLILWGIVFER